MLSRDDDSWWLRNIEKGARWRVPDCRFPPLGMGSLITDCPSIIFQDGTRLLFKGHGEPETVPSLEDGDGGSRLRLRFIEGHFKDAC